MIEPVKLDPSILTAASNRQRLLAAKTKKKSRKAEPKSKLVIEAIITTS
jgi:hypothetical protein